MCETPESVGMSGKNDENGAWSTASSSQLWRLNEVGLLELRDEPGRSLMRGEMKEVLAEAARRGLWQPAPRGARGPVRVDG